MTTSHDRVASPAPATPRRPSPFVYLAAVAAVIALLFSPSRVPAEPDRSPVLVELFTSQGCSSCPPADRLLSTLVQQDGVIALSFHVDYWNYIGWTDPFSSERWSERQRAYAAAFRSNRIYTPQLVVNGRWEGVGSDSREVNRLIRQADGSLSDDLRLTITKNGPRLTARLAATVRSGSPHAWLAVTESGFSTPVGRGENRDHTLRNDNVVRHLEPVELSEAEAGEIEIEIDPEWKRDRVRLVAFLQDPATMAVTAAAQTALP